VRVVLEGYTPITPARWLRTVTVEANEPLVRLDTRSENIGARAFDFIWGVHPALRLDDAVTTGLARTLDPGQTFHASVRGVVYGGVEGVSHLGPDGSVVAGDSALRRT
jgi:hypothetical protein